MWLSQNIPERCAAVGRSGRQRPGRQWRGWRPGGPQLAPLLLLMLLAGTGRARAQQAIRVSGTVSGADTRQPIPGATVLVERTRNAVAAGVRGEFDVEALSTDTLQFRAVGYKPRRLPLGGSGLTQLVVRVVLTRDSILLGEVRVVQDRADRATINRALRNLRKPPPKPVSQVRRPPRPKPLFAVDSAAPKPPVPTLENPVSLLYEQFSRAGKERRKMAELEAQAQAEKARKAREVYNRQFKDNRGYE